MTGSRAMIVGSTQWGRQPLPPVVGRLSGAYVGRARGMEWQDHFLDVPVASGMGTHQLMAQALVGGDPVMVANAHGLLATLDLAMRMHYLPGDEVLWSLHGGSRLFEPLCGGRERHSQGTIPVQGVTPAQVAGLQRALVPEWSGPTVVELRWYQTDKQRHKWYKTLHSTLIASMHMDDVLSAAGIYLFGFNRGKGQDGTTILRIPVYSLFHSLCCAVFPERGLRTFPVDGEIATADVLAAMRAGWRPEGHPMTLLTRIDEDTWYTAPRYIMHERRHIEVALQCVPAQFRIYVALAQAILQWGQEVQQAVPWIQQHSGDDDMESYADLVHLAEDVAETNWPRIEQFELEGLNKAALCQRIQEWIRALPQQAPALAEHGFDAEYWAARFSALFAGTV